MRFNYNNNMKPEPECIPCLLNQALKISSILKLDQQTQKKIMGEAMKLLSDIELDKTTPHYTREIWHIIKNHTNNPDPYKETKAYYNRIMNDRKVMLREFIEEAANKFRTAVKIAITGNIIDFGAKHDIEEKDIIREVDSKSSKPLFIDHHKALQDRLMSSKNLMILGDNCGEIVFDRLLIEQVRLLNPDLDITYVVRGAPIINDITMLDAEQVKMHEVARVIDNGHDAPGTEIEDVSDSFRREFYAADVVISKGQGNYESLSHIDRKDIFFLFMVKCSTVARQTDAPRGSLVCLHKEA